MSNLAIRTGIQDLEDALLDLPKDEQIDLDALTTHHFSPGIYARQLIIPAGVVLTGKIHKTEHLNIVSKGKIAVSSVDGRKVIEAPAIFVSKPGTKRAGYAIEETVWTTIHPSYETDVKKLEAELVTDNYSEIEMIEKLKCLSE